MRKVYSGKIVLNSDYDGAERARRGWPKGIADAISFGRTVSSPIPTWSSASAAARRSTRGDWTTFYTQGPEGYTDYPRLTEQDGRLTGSSP